MNRHGLMGAQNDGKIGIIGTGIVGSAIEYWFEKKFEIIVHDPKRGTKIEDLISQTTFAYIAVPTPQNETTGECDVSILLEVLDQLPNEFTAVIKSTIIPGTTDMLMDKYPNLKLAFSPEFLVERRFIEDFGNQDLVIVGTLHDEIAKTVFNHHKIAGVLEDDATCVQLKPIEAELVKYTKNTFYALKVIFANQMYDICQELGVDWSIVKDTILSTNKQAIGPSHLGPIRGIRRGFGGKCLPKDTVALSVLADQLNVKYDFLDAILSDNQKLRKIRTGKPSEISSNDD